MKLFPQAFLFSVLVAFFTPSAFSSEMVAEIAKQVTVRIEGATQGSGVLIEKLPHGYKVLTAWHVLKNQGKSEEIDIITTDGIVYTTNGMTISKIANVDLATIEFNAENKYSIADLKQSTRSAAGQTVFVYGFPLATSAVQKRLGRFVKGELIANAPSYMKDGYQLIYSNPTLPGMSGGPLLNHEGYLIGIHGKGETDFELSEQSGVAVKTGNNLAIPISYFKLKDEPISVLQSKPKAFTYDDYIWFAETAMRSQDWEAQREAAEKATKLNPSIMSYYYLSFAYKQLGENSKAMIASYKALKIEPRTASDYYWRGGIKISNSINGETGYLDYKKAYFLDQSNNRYARAYMLVSPTLEGAEASLQIMHYAVNHKEPVYGWDDIARACLNLKNRLDEYPEYVRKKYVKAEPERYEMLKETYLGLKATELCD